jgi:hypothetical protein
MEREIDRIDRIYRIFKKIRKEILSIMNHPVYPVSFRRTGRAKRGASAGPGGSMASVLFIGKKCYGLQDQ